MFSKFNKHIAGLILSPMLALPFAGTAQARVIDSFETAQAKLSDYVSTPGYQASLATGSGILGGQRELTMQASLGDNAATALVSNGGFSLSMESGVKGLAVMTWDGSDTDTDEIVTSGLGHLNLSGDGSTAFTLVVDSADRKIDGVIWVFSDETHYSVMGFQLPGDIDDPTLFQIDYDDFFKHQDAVGAADFANVGAIALYLSTPSLNTDITIGSFGTNTPLNTPSLNAVPEPTSLALLGLGLGGVAVSRRKAKKQG